MNPQEILPSLEKKTAPQGSEVTDAANEIDGARAVEQKSQAAKDGSGIVTAAAVGDAQQHIQGLPQSQQGDDHGSSSDDGQVLDVPDVAEDIDLIEKEWVKKAKDIVDATYGDPYTQNKQISKMKVEYIKKRYDRQIKTRDE